MLTQTRGVKLKYVIYGIKEIVESDSLFTDSIRSQLKQIDVIKENDYLRLAQETLDETDIDTELSLLAQQLCFLSDFFLFSKSSTWSLTVLLERTCSQRNDNLFNLNFEIKKN